MALTDAQMGQLALALYHDWQAVSQDRTELQRAVALVFQYLDASAGKSGWNVTATRYGLPGL